MINPANSFAVELQRGDVNDFWSIKYLRFASILVNRVVFGNQKNKNPPQDKRLAGDETLSLAPAQEWEESTP